MTREEEIAYESGREDGLRDGESNKREAEEEAYDAGYDAGFGEGEEYARQELQALRTSEDFAEMLRCGGLSHLEGVVVRWDAARKAIVASEPFTTREVVWGASK